MNRCFLLIAIGFLLASTAKAQVSGLDSTFGTNGKVIAYPVLPWSTSGAFASLSVAPDGKILALGSLGTTTVARLHNNGKFDSTFGANGLYVRPDNEWFFPFSATDLVLQANGGIIVGGRKTDTSISINSYSFALIRLKANGTLDSSFGNQGLVLTKVSAEPLSKDWLRKMALQADGRIVAAGTAQDTLALVRYLPNGDLDSSFGNYGRVITLIGTWRAEVGDVDIQPDGKIVVGIEAETPGRSFVGVRYMPNGILDTTFGSGGISAHYIGSLAYVKAMKLQPDGRILIAGAAGGELKVLRLLQDGSRDTSFGSNGVFGTEGAIASCLAVRQDGKIVVGGYTDADTEDYVLLRLLPTGKIDSSFGINGKLITVVGINDERMADLVLQQDEKILVCGAFAKDNPSWEYNAVVLRYNQNATLDLPPLSAEDGITLYPVPVDGRLHIRNLSTYKITSLSLYSVDGRLMANPILENGGFPTSGYPVGMYFLRIQLSPEHPPLVRRLLIRH